MACIDGLNSTGREIPGRCPREPRSDAPVHTSERGRPPCRSALAVFALYAVVNVVGLLLATELVLEAMEGAPAGVRDELYGIVGELAVAVVALTVVGAILHLIGGLGTEGDVVDSLIVAGWSYAPEVVTFPLAATLIVGQLAGMTIDASDPSVLAAEAERVMGGGAFLPAVALQVAVAAWSVVIMAKGLLGLHEADPARAWAAALLVGVGALVLGFA